MDKGSGNHQYFMTEKEDYTGRDNQRIVPELND